MEMKRYDGFKISDFVLDSDFQAWVNGDDTNLNNLWNDWLKINPDRSAEIDKAKEILLALNFRKVPVDAKTVNAEWEKLKLLVTSSPIEEPVYKKKSKTIYWPLRIAATIALLVATYFTINQLTRQEINEENISFVQLEVANGQKLDLTLIDGTSIKLNAGSTLSYPEKFSSGKREVFLTGEAFFRVNPDQEAPFIVHTGNVTTTVLGTSFNINAYPELDQVYVAVVEGKVKVSSNELQNEKRNEVFLSPDELATLPKTEGEIIISKFDENDLLAWRNGILHFDQSDFDEAIHMLERWYGVKFEINSTKRISPDWRYHGKFENRSLDYILNVFRYPDQFTFQIDGARVFIK